MGIEQAVAAHGHEQRRLVGDELGQFVGQRLDRQRAVEAELFGGRVGADPVAVPDLAFQVLAAAEQDAAVFGARDQDQPGLGFGKTGQVEEVAVEAERELGVAIADEFTRGGQDRDAAAAGMHGVQHAPAARGERGEVRGGNAHGDGSVRGNDQGLL